jgi:hypothetical protein
MDRGGGRGRSEGGRGSGRVGRGRSGRGSGRGSGSVGRHGHGERGSYDRGGGSGLANQAALPPPPFAIVLVETVAEAATAMAALSTSLASPPWVRVGATPRTALTLWQTSPLSLHVPTSRIVPSFTRCRIRSSHASLHTWVVCLFIYLYSLSCFARPHTK